MPKAESRSPASGGDHVLRLPAAALAALYLTVCLLPLALALTRSVAPADPWELAAAAFGLVALAAMAVQVVTSGRFERVSGHLGIDKIMAFHKIAAWWVLLALLLHPLAYVLPTWLDDRALGAERLTAYLTLPHYRSGVVALAALVLLVASSVLRDRLPWRYEVWRASHVILALTALSAGLHHAVAAGRFSALGSVQAYWWAVGAAVAGAMAVLYGWRWLRLHLRPWQLQSVTRRADRLWELDIQPAPGTPALRYQAGQFVWMTEGARRFPLFDHPFSIADSPLRPGLSLIVKEAGDFTSRIGTLAPGTPIGIDGPYGDFTLDAHRGDSVLLLAGGVGIAPIMGLLRDLVARRDPRPVRLAYAAGRPDNFACLDEIEAARQHLDLQTFLVSEDDAPGWRGLVGRLDRERLGQMLAGLDPARSVALICGPGPMVTAVSDALLDLGIPMRKVVYERFDYSGGASRQDHRRRLSFVGVGALLSLGILLFVRLVA
ncbi:ferredoxin reductase family protein [Polymorphum gilvum]|uniref:Ferric reductase domain protein transmembrane component domain n=1 Tax=Polymorphum gilvum (strain LMG 25793 / CGMCC 1.9160 / SL003B-26A1) TaxID=991905 RepID=F2J3G4_POLGS|nr:ferric reductase-like transmembrane domain-containing protein [Polymorphum gilvum]ADZ70989.1 Ferric reductase domain protein transmembrane component domain [Polymorphum gilvum SL003B-26A1]